MAKFSINRQQWEDITALMNARFSWQYRIEDPLLKSEVTRILACSLDSSLYREFWRWVWNYMGVWDDVGGRFEEQPPDFLKIQDPDSQVTPGRLGKAVEAVHVNVLSERQIRTLALVDSRDEEDLCLDILELSDSDDESKPPNPEGAGPAQSKGTTASASILEEAHLIKQGQPHVRALHNVLTPLEDLTGAGPSTLQENSPTTSGVATTEQVPPEVRDWTSHSAMFATDFRFVDVNGRDISVAPFLMPASNQVFLVAKVAYAGVHSELAACLAAGYWDVPGMKLDAAAAREHVPVQLIGQGSLPHFRNGQDLVIWARGPKGLYLLQYPHSDYQARFNLCHFYRSARFDSITLNRQNPPSWLDVQLYRKLQASIEHPMPNSANPPRDPSLSGNQNLELEIEAGVVAARAKVDFYGRMLVGVQQSEVADQGLQEAIRRKVGHWNDSLHVYEAKLAKLGKQDNGGALTRGP